MRNLLLKIQELPGHRKKIIFWMVMVVLTLTLSGFYIKYVQKKVANIKLEKTKEELQIHSLEEILNKVPKIEIPKIEIPEIGQETLQELERMTEQTSTEATNCQPCQPIE